MLFSDGKPAKLSLDEYRRLSTVKFTSTSERFQFKERKNDYSKQYAHIYGRRLEQMRPLLQKKAVEKWGWFNFNNNSSEFWIINHEVYLIFNDFFYRKHISNKKDSRFA